MAAVAAAPPIQGEAQEEQIEASPETMALPMIDGQSIDRIEVKVTGGVRLDRSDAADVALMRRLKLGEEVEIKVVAVVSRKPFEVVHDEDGYPGEVTSIAQLKVTSLYRPVGDGVEARTDQKQLDLGGIDDDGPH